MAAAAAAKTKLGNATEFANFARAAAPLVLVGGAIWLGSNFIRELLEVTNLTDTKEEKATKRTGTAQNRAGIWSVKNWQTVKKGYKRTLFPVAKLNYVTKEIYDSFNWYNDDEERVYAAFRLINNKLEVSQVAANYIAKHKTDLYNYLKYKLTTEELDVVQTMVELLPSGYI